MNSWQLCSIFPRNCQPISRSDKASLLPRGRVTKRQRWIIDGGRHITECEIFPHRFHLLSYRTHGIPSPIPHPPVLPTHPFSCPSLPGLPPIVSLSLSLSLFTLPGSCSKGNVFWNKSIWQSDLVETFCPLCCNWVKLIADCSLLFANIFRPLFTQELCFPQKWITVAS